MNFNLDFLVSLIQELERGKTVVLFTLDKQGTWKAVKLMERCLIKSYYKTKEWEREPKEEFSSLTYT